MSAIGSRGKVKTGRESSPKTFSLSPAKSTVFAPRVCCTNEETAAGLTAGLLAEFTADTKVRCWTRGALSCRNAVRRARVLLCEAILSVYVVEICDNGMIFEYLLIFGALREKFQTSHNFAEAGPSEIGMKRSIIAPRLRDLDSPDSVTRPFFSLIILLATTRRNHCLLPRCGYVRR